MAITSLPTFADDEILSAGKLNQLRSAIETKFAGAITGGDIAWPLVAQGSLDMAGFSILSVKRFWNVFNADEYATLQEAIDAAEAAGGGCVFIPPNTTFSADGLTVTQSDIAIVGCGASSVIAHSSGASSGYLLRSSAGLSNLTVAHLKLDGSTNASAGQSGLYFQQATGVHLDHVVFDDFTGDHVRFENDGTAGNNCADVWVTDCVFDNGDAGHIFMNDVDGAHIAGCRFDGATTDAIEGVPDAAASKMRSIEVTGCRFVDGVRAVYIVGDSGTANDLWRLVRVHNNEAFSQSGDAITVGATSAVVKHGQIADNNILSVTGDAIVANLAGGMVSDNYASGVGGDAIVASIDDGNVSDNHVLSVTGDAIVASMTVGKISGNYAASAGGDGLDMTSASDIEVSGNNFADAGARGIDATSSTNCRILNNDVHGATTEGITKASATGLVCNSNHGDHNTTVDTVYVAAPNETAATAGSGTFAANYTIPANTLKVGDVVRIRAQFSHTGTGDLSGAGPDFGGGQQADFVMTNSSHSCAGEWVAIVEALSGAGSTIVSHIGVNNNNGAYAQQSSLNVDWTSDVQIDIDWTKANSSNGFDLIMFTVELIGGST